MENEILQKILSELQEIKGDVQELKQGQAETNKRLDKLEQGQAKLEKAVKENNRLIAEAFEDIGMLDSRTESLKKAK